MARALFIFIAVGTTLRVKEIVGEQVALRGGRTWSSTWPSVRSS
jgi:hypothetical protein